MVVTGVARFPSASKYLEFLNPSHTSIRAESTESGLSTLATDGVDYLWRIVWRVIDDGRDRVGAKIFALVGVEQLFRRRFVASLEPGRLVLPFKIEVSCIANRGPSLWLRPVVE